MSFKRGGINFCEFFADEPMMLTEIPTLYTERLMLRPFSLADVPIIVALAGDWNIARNTLSIPHPYKEEHAVQYVTEAARAVINFGFEKLSLHRIQATHFGNNPASGRVMQKVGMLYEGCRRQHTLKWGEYRDIKLYGILRYDWETAVKNPPPLEVIPPHP